MKITELNATVIVKKLLDKKLNLLPQNDLQIVFKRRFTKKQRELLQLFANNISKEEICNIMNIDTASFNQILSESVKKIKNPRINKDFFTQNN